ncbi:MAG: polysaccharide deacetylase family protein [Firmicutes bacterium]|nr:polysaccharide deacetylase family protein [Bacillota bacterium]
MTRLRLAILLVPVVILAMVAWHGGKLPVMAYRQFSELEQSVGTGFYQARIGAHRGDVIWSGRTSEKLVALTFDDGPDPRFTPEVLDILEEDHVPATFFVVGKYAARYPDLVVREIQDGNEVGNHTYDHPNLLRDNPEQIRAEISDAGAIIEEITGKPLALFRPPKGLINRAGLEIAREQGYKIVFWGVATEHREAPTPDLMAARVIRQARPGIIILAHDGRLDRSKTVAALPAIIKGYQAMGYRFVTVSQLMAQATRTGAR